MAVALDPSLAQAADGRLLSSLVVVDVAPTRIQLSSEFAGYVEGMKAIERMQLRTRGEALGVLEEYEKVLFPPACA